MSDAIETCHCEHCGKEHPIEESVAMVDCTFCPECYARWKADFDACPHEWEPHHDEHGDPGQYCRRCAGFVNEDVFAEIAR